MNPSPFASAKHINKPKDVETINDPAIWDNPEWFRRKYHEEGIGTPTIARIINRSIVLVVGRLRRYGISLRHHSEAVKSRSIHCSREWLHEQYYVKKQSLKECAGMAGVSPYTIYNWLVKFGMEPRTMHQAMAGEMNPFHGRKHTEETKNKIREALRQKKKSATNVSPP
jgi:transposase